MLLKSPMKVIVSLLLCAGIANSAAQADVTKNNDLISESIEVIAEGIRVVKVYRDSMTVDTFTVEKWIALQQDSGKTLQELQELNRILQQLNEQMKKDEWNHKPKEASKPAFQRH